MVTEEVIIKIQEDGGSSLSAVLAKLQKELLALKKAGEEGIGGDKSSGKGVGGAAGAAAGEVDKLAKATKKLQEQGAFKRAAADSEEYVAALKESKAAQKELADATRATATEAELLDKALTRAAQQAGMKEAAAGNEAYIASLQRARAAQQALNAEVRAPELAAKEAAKEAALAQAQQDAFVERVEKTQEALKILGRTGEDALRLIETQGEAAAEQLREIAEEIQKAEREAAKARATLADPAAVRRLKEARAEVERLELQTQSLTERVAKVLEVFENVTGTLDLATLAAQGLVGAFNLLETGAVRADLEATARAAGLTADKIAEIRGRTGGTLTQEQEIRTELGGLLGGLTSAQTAATQELGTIAARIQSTLSGDRIGDIQEGLIASLQEELRTGELGPTFELLIGNTANYSAALERLARETGGTVETLTSAQRANVLLTTAFENSAARAGVIDTSRAEAFARFERDLKDTGTAFLASIQGAPSTQEDQRNALLAEVLRESGVSIERLAASTTESSSFAAASIDRVREALTAKIEELGGTIKVLAEGGDQAELVRVLQSLQPTSQSAQETGIRRAPGGRIDEAGPSGISAAEESAGRLNILIGAARAELATTTSEAIALQNELVNLSAQQGREGAANLERLGELIQSLGDSTSIEELVTSEEGVYATLVAQAEERERNVQLISDELSRILGIDRAEAQRIVTQGNINSLINVGNTLANSALPALRDAVNAEKARLEARQSLGDALSEEERKANALRLVELERESILAKEARSLEELRILQASAREQATLTLERERVLLELRQESGDVLSATEKDLLDVEIAYNALQRQARAVSETEEAFEARLLEGAIQKALAAQGDEWDEILTSIGFAGDWLDDATSSAEKFEEALRLAAQAGVGAREILSGVVAGVGDEGAEKQGEDAAKDKEDDGTGGGRGRGGRDERRALLDELARAEEDARLELLAAQGRLVEELQAGSLPAVAAIVGTDGRLASRVDLELAQAATELDRWFQDQIARAGQDADAIEAIADVYAARAETILTGLRQESFAAGVESVEAFASGVMNAGAAALSGTTSFLEEAAANAELVQANLVDRLNAELEGAGDLFADRAASDEAFAANLAAAEGNAAAELAVRQDRERQLIEFQQREIDLVTAHRLALHEQHWGMAEDLRQATDAQVAAFEKLEGAAGLAVIGVADAALIAGQVYADAGEEILRIQGELEANRISEAQAATGSAAALIGATASATSGIIKNERARAGIKGAVQVAEGAAAIAEGNIPGAVLHGIAATKFFAVALTGSGGGSGASSAASAGAGRGLGGASRGTALTAQAIDLRGLQSAPKTITQVFVNPITGTSMVREINSSAAAGAVERLDQNTVSSRPLRMDP